ncbi:MAG: HD domain-containing protein, partial [Butyrivibrio sp.]|nr:HD domain-containing protein [Butyrivibrio sp.]
AFLTAGKNASGYREEETELESIRNASEEIEYVYVYRILEDGCHVVFDIDTEDEEGASPGTVMPFDEAFAPYIAQLLAGEEIDVVISDETYGWLLTAYAPVRDSRGVTQAYAAVDINMQRVRRNEISYIAKVVALFFGFFILILAIGLWLAEYNLLLPINTMALAAGELAATISDGRTDGTARMEHLGIHTGDEIEHLYESFTRTMRDTVRYIADAQAKSETISQMQNGLILVLADMVESRDKCTGDHVRKTAAYTRIIMEQMQRNGDYAGQVTDAFIEDVANSAPLHDVGKIRVSDTILNKPGKLTDEEFAQMKKHTVYGREVIEQAIAIVPDSGYLKEAQNLATYHHEKWNGKGYPYGLAGEEIPLSARIMAVADVFDALVSRRSYKEPYSFEKACDIIREESGSHFDPVVAAAFLQNEAGARQVYETHYEHSAQAEPEMKDTGKQERPGE